MKIEGPEWGYLSSDGKFIPLSSETSQSLEYASKTILQLQEMLFELIKQEKYEDCILIRDEINKRKQ